MEFKVSQSVIEELVHGIKPPSEEWRRKARQRLDTLTKPLGSLGRLEDIAAHVAAIRGEQFSDSIRKAVYVFAADHGVTEEGVSAYPREVTRQMVLNFLAEGAAINVLARKHGAALHVVDVGVDANFDSISGLLHDKVRRGTRNMLREPAMSEEDKRDGNGASKLIDEALAQKAQPKREALKVGRNDPCPCGSGKKYKNCCGRTA